MTDQPAPRPDVADMVAVHDVFRDCLGCGPALIDAVAADDPGRTAMLANFYENILAFLHVHHLGEEELVFPLLRERCPDQRALIERVAAQHTDVVEAIGQAHGLLAAWSAGDGGAQQGVGRALGELGAQAGVHFDDEERELLPLCAAHLSLPEWGALPGHGMAGFEGDKIWLVLGLIRQRMSPGQRDAMLEHMPPPAVEMWTTFGEDAFTTLMAEVGAPLG